MRHPILATALLGACFLTAAAHPAHAHAHFRDAQPSAGSIAAAPQDLRILFSSGVDVGASQLAITAADGSKPPLPPLAGDPAEPKALTVHLAQPLPPGSYTVAWTAIEAGSGHRTQGTYAFAVAQPGGVLVGRPWARATAPRQETGAAYMTLTSPGGDTLVSASSPVAARAEVHENKMDGTVMRMREVASLPLPAGQALALEPGGYHLMLIGLKQPLQAGQHIPVQLRFARGGTVDVDVTVAANGAAPAMGGMGGMEGHAH